MPVTMQQIEKIHSYGERLTSLILIMDELDAWRDRHCGVPNCAAKSEPGAACPRITKVFDSFIRSVPREKYVATARRWLDAKNWLVDGSGRTIEGLALMGNRLARPEMFEMQIHLCEEFMRGTLEILNWGENAQMSKKIIERWECGRGEPKK